MPSPSFALQQAIFTRLAADAGVLALLGGAPRIHDDVPQGNAAFPYITFAETTVRDWSTASEDGAEHIVTLHAWSRAAGAREAKEILGAVRTALHDQALTLSGHRLVNLRQEFADTRREPDGDTFRGLARFRAVTEPI